MDTEDFDIAINYWDEDEDGFREYVASFGTADELRQGLEDEWDLVLDAAQAYDLFLAAY